MKSKNCVFSVAVGRKRWKSVRAAVRGVQMGAGRLPRHHDGA